MRRFAVVLVALLCSCDEAQTSGLTRVRQSGVLRWGGDIQGGEPYVSEDASQPGRYVGFEVELADAIARKLGVRAQFMQNDWSNLVPALERGSFDIAMNGLEVTPARADRVRFTRPYFVFSAQLVVRRNDTRNLDGIATLRGLRVGTLANSYGWDLLQNSGAQAIAYEGVEEPYADLRGGRLDAVVLDDIIANRYGLVHSDLRLASDLGDGYYAVACRPRERDLCDAIDHALAELARDGTLREIYQRWNIDSPREARLAAWTDADTETMLRSRSHATFSLDHVWLFVKGAGVTILVSTLAMTLAVLLGLALALGRAYAPRAVATIAQVYVEIFRGTPVLLQLYLLYFGVMPFFRELLALQSAAEELHLRAAAAAAQDAGTSAWLYDLLGDLAGGEWDAFVAAVIGLGLNYAAYEAEIYRAGIQAVPPGQMEAAHALGMSTPLAVRRVILPQASRIALPGMTNDFIALLKDSSLVSVITVVELTKRMTITAVDVRSWAVPGLMCAALYLAMSWPLSRVSARLEAKLEGEK